MSDKQKKIAILVPDGVGVRNYLYSKVFDGIKNNCVLLHNFNEQALNIITNESKITQNKILPQYKETIIEKFYRELIHLSRLKWNVKQVDNPTILTNYNPKKSNLKNRLFYGLIELFSDWITNYDKISWLEKKYFKFLKKNKNYDLIKKLLIDLKPEVLICTHQRAINAPLIFLIAKELKINSYSFIYSWDNLPKARMALRADNYLVWSDYMKKELMLFYPEVKDHQIKVTGSPQFEFSENKNNIIPKDEFYKTYNLDFNKRNICYSANDLTSPNEVLYLQDLINNLRENNAFDEYQLLFRINPADLSGRFDNLLHENNNIIKDVSPKWNTGDAGNWASTIPTLEDVKLLTSTCFYSDIVINFGSTMVFDFSVFNKPCIYIHYNKEQNSKLDINISYNFQHFRSMPTKKSVAWVNTKDDFYDVIKDILNENYSVNAKEWFNTIVYDYKNSSKNIREELLFK